MEEGFEVFKMLVYIFWLNEDIVYVYYGKCGIRVKYVVHDFLKFWGGIF